MSDKDKFYEVLDSFDNGMLTTFTADGTPHGRPMHVAERDGDTLWFLTGVDSAKVREAATAHPAVLTFQAPNKWLAATGEAVTSHDRAKVQQLWSEPMKAWFPGGPEDPGVAALKVELSSGEFWAMDAGDLASYAFGVVRSMVTGKPVDPDAAGEHADVRM